MMWLYDLVGLAKWLQMLFIYTIFKNLLLTMGIGDVRVGNSFLHSDPSIHVYHKCTGSSLKCYSIRLVMVFMLFMLSESVS